MRRPSRWWLATLPAVALLCGCEERTPSGASREASATRQLQDRAAVEVGMPAILNFTEKRNLKLIYELRDNAKLVTYTYTRDMYGKRHSVCPTTSVGFPVPYATQYTAPKATQRWYLPKTADYNASWGTREAEQPEPNGLHMPSSADGTWVTCLSPDMQSVGPVYTEPHVETYLWEMPHAD